MATGYQRHLRYKSARGERAGEVPSFFQAGCGESDILKRTCYMMMTMLLLSCYSQKLMTKTLKSNNPKNHYYHLLFLPLNIIKAEQFTIQRSTGNTDYCHFMRMYISLMSLFYLIFGCPLALTSDMSRTFMNYCPKIK